MLELYDLLAFDGTPGVVAHCLLLDAFSTASHWDGSSECTATVVEL